MNRVEILKLGVSIERAKVELQDACVYLRRNEKIEDLAVAELIVKNVRELQSMFEKWASLEFGLGLHNAVVDAAKQELED